MLKVFDLCARAVFIALAGIIIFRLWVFFSPRPIDSYVHGGLIGAEQTETLFTGFATVPVLYFYTNGKLHRFDPSTQERGIPEKVNGFCYHLYDLAIGYENFAKAIDTTLEGDSNTPWRLPEPEVLAANIVETRRGGALSRYQCDATDYAPTDIARAARMERFVELLQSNQQWAPHQKNAHAVLLALDKDLRKVHEQETQHTANLNHTPKIAAASFFPVASAQAVSSGEYSNSMPSGSLGSLKLTFATIALFTRDKNWFFQKNEFYVRQDNAEVTYGSEFYHDFTASRQVFGAPKVSVTLPEPRALAVNRFTLALEAHPKKFDPAPHKKGGNSDTHDEVLHDPIERALTKELDRQMARVEGQAIMISKGLITDQIRGLMRDHNADVVVRFEKKRNQDDGAALIELLRKETIAE